MGIVALACVGSEIGGEKAVNVCDPDEFWCGPTHERHWHVEERVPMPLDTGASVTQSYTTTTSAMSHIVFSPDFPRIK
jgi:hypothetical protein